MKPMEGDCGHGVKSKRRIRQQFVLSVIEAKGCLQPVEPVQKLQGLAYQMSRMKLLEMSVFRTTPCLLRPRALADQAGRDTQQRTNPFVPCGEALLDGITQAILLKTRSLTALPSHLNALIGVLQMISWRYLGQGCRPHGKRWRKVLAVPGGVWEASLFSHVSSGTTRPAGKDLTLKLIQLRIDPREAGRRHRSVDCWGSCRAAKCVVRKWQGQESLNPVILRSKTDPFESGLRR